MYTLNHRRNYAEFPVASNVTTDGAHSAAFVHRTLSFLIELLTTSLILISF